MWNVFSGFSSKDLEPDVQHGICVDISQDTYYIHYRMG